MSTIRAACWKDLLRVPAFDLGADGKIIMPLNGGIPNSWGPYSLVAEAPGKNLMGFVSASLRKDEDTQEVIGFIDECRGNRLYEQMEPMVGLISGLEKILCREKVVCAIETRLPDCSSTKTFQMYRGLEYEATTVDGVVELGQRMVPLRKNILQEQEATGQEAACIVEAIVAQGARQEIRRASREETGSPEETEHPEASTSYVPALSHPDSQEEEEDELILHQKLSHRVAGSKPGGRKRVGSRDSSSEYGAYVVPSADDGSDAETGVGASFES